MKFGYWLILLSLASACSVAKPVVTVVGFDRIKYGDPRYELLGRTYDNLPENIMPNILLDYYHSLDLKAFKSIVIKIDTTAKAHDVYSASAIMLSKKAKNGYLYVNNEIMKKVEELKCDIGEVSVSYFRNNKAILSDKDVCKFVKFKKKDVQSLSIEKEDSTMVKVSVQTRKK